MRLAVNKAQTKEKWCEEFANLDKHYLRFYGDEVRCCCCCCDCHCRTLDFETRAGICHFIMAMYPVTPMHLLTRMCVCISISL